MKIFVVIPVYNEGQHLKQVLQEFAAYNYELVVVDDGSDDNVEAIVKHFPAVHYLHHSVNRGYGAAIRTGEAYALMRCARIIVHFDGDGQHSARSVTQLIWPIILNKADVVLGSRFKDNGQAIPFVKRYLILKPAIMLHNLFLGLSLTDAHNGLRAFSRHAVQKLRTSQDRMAYASEIIAQIKRQKLRVVEVAVRVNYREYGQGFIDGLKIFGDLIKKKILRP